MPEFKIRARRILQLGLIFDVKINKEFESPLIFQGVLGLINADLLKLKLFLFIRITSTPLHQPLTPRVVAFCDGHTLAVENDGIPAYKTHAHCIRWEGPKSACRKKHRKQ